MIEEKNTIKKEISTNEEVARKVKVVKLRTKLHRGGWNLVALGVISTIIALVTTGVSLAVYHNSGDIYLDRSRPGFLPDEEEAEEEATEEEDYNFDNGGVLNVEALDEYLEKLQVEIDAIKAEEKPFDVNILADDSLGIPKAE